MTINEAMNFDKAFFTTCIDECLRICTFYVERGEPSQGDFRDAKNTGLRLIQNHGHASGLLPHDLQDLEDQFYELNYQFHLKAHGLNDEVKQVSEPAPSTQVHLFRLLGKASQIQTASTLKKQSLSASLSAHCFTVFNIGWLPTFTVTKRPLSNARSVGGLA